MPRVTLFDVLRDMAMRSRYNKMRYGRPMRRPRFVGSPRFPGNRNRRMMRFGVPKPSLGSTLRRKEYTRSKPNTESMYRGFGYGESRSALESDYNRSIYDESRNFGYEYSRYEDERHEYPNSGFTESESSGYNDSPLTYDPNRNKKE